MNINRNNYAEFFLDYWEGNLSAKQEALLYEFLEVNEELKEEFESFENISLHQDESISYPDKQKLKKEIINLSEFEEKCIAYFEGDIDSKSESELLILIKENETLSKIFDTFSRARLQKDNSIVFEEKTALKRGQTIFSINRNYLYRSFAAAAIIILIGMYFIISLQNENEAIHSDPVITDNLEQRESILVPVKIPENKIAKLEKSNISRTLSVQTDKYNVYSIDPLPYKQIVALNTDNKNKMAYNPESFIYSDNTLLTYSYLIPAANGENKSLLGRIAGNVGQKIRNFFTPAKDLFETEDDKLFWNIAETGINGYNLLTNNSYELVRYMGPDGKTKSVKLIDNEEYVSIPSE